MAAAEESGSPAGPAVQLAGCRAVKTEPEDEDVSVPEVGAVLRREPVVSLPSPLSGVRPVTWSRDHRLAVSTGDAVAVVELVCDVRTNKQDMAVLRTAVPLRPDVLQLQVGSARQLTRAREQFSSHPDPTVHQAFMADYVMNPTVGTHRGVKFTSWSPLGCDASGRCLLAVLSLDHRLTVHNSVRRLDWNTLTDLTAAYSRRLAARNYARDDGKDADPAAEVEEEDLGLEELRRRFRMQTPLRMQWSSVYTVKQPAEDHACREAEMVLLAVLMESGDLVLWRFDLPFAAGGAEPVVFAVIHSEVAAPSDVAWWEHEAGGRRMSGLIVGSDEGPVKIMPVAMAGVKGYFTLRKPVVLWQEADGVPVDNLRCVSMFHPVLRANCSLVVASRGCYVFWCLLMISPQGLSVHNAHVAGLHSLPVVSLAATRQGGVAVYTCSMDGEVKKLVPHFTDGTMVFKREEVLPPDTLPGRRPLAIAVSPNGAYLALANTQGMAGGLHPVDRTYQVNFVSLKTPRAAGALVLTSPGQSLYRQADLLDLLRWKVLRDKTFPPDLMAEVDEKIRAFDSAYFWKFKLFLLRVLLLSLQEKTPADPRWKPSHRDPKVLSGDRGGEEGEGTGGEDVLALQRVKEEDTGRRMAEVKADMAVVEAHLTREHMKKVLGDVYLNIWSAVNTSIPTCGIVDYLSGEPGDRAAEVLIGHIKKKMQKQKFPERCSLCVEDLPFSNYKQAVCKNGHIWPRCVLSYQSCQDLTFQRCILMDSVAAEPRPDAPEWIRRILKGPCSFCDSPMI